MNNPMNTELYNKIFQRLDELGYVRECEIQHASMTHEPYKDTPILSDVLNAMDMSYMWSHFT